MAIDDMEKQIDAMGDLPYINMCLGGGITVWVWWFGSGNLKFTEACFLKRGSSLYYNIMW